MDEYAALKEAGNLENCPKEMERYADFGIFTQNPACENYEIQNTYKYYLKAEDALKGCILEEKINGTFDINKLSISGFYNNTFEMNGICQKIEYDGEFYDLDSIDVKKVGNSFYRMPF